MKRPSAMEKQNDMDPHPLDIRRGRHYAGAFIAGDM